MYRTTVNQDIATILFTNLSRNLVSLHCTMSGQVVLKSSRKIENNITDKTNISNTSWSKFLT